MSRRAGGWLAILVVVAAIGPALAPYDPSVLNSSFMHAPPMRPRVVGPDGPALPFVYAIALEDRLAQRFREDPTRRRPLPWFDTSPDEPVYLLGADNLGRDQLSRLMHGARTSLALALLSTALAVALGAVLGALAAYHGGWVERLVMGAADFVIVLPLIYVLLLLRQLMPVAPSDDIIFAVTTAIFVVVGWPFAARGVRTIVAVERQREYVDAARALGASTGRVLGRHLLPACAPHLVVQATLLLPAFVIAEATLSYAGLGFSDSMPTWGTMLREAASVAAITRFPWTLAPAVAIFVVILTTNAMLRSDRIVGRPERPW